MKIIKILSFFVMFLFLLAACKEEPKKKNEPLTAKDSLNLKLVKNDNVALLGSPPMIPKDHPVEIGDDISLHQNGGQDCLDCHDDPEEEDAPQTLHPERHNCLQCHIPERDDIASEEDFKVDNVFKKETKF